MVRSSGENMGEKMDLNLLGRLWRPWWSWLESTVLTSTWWPASGSVT